MEQLESRQLLTAYYIDPVKGSDSNPGTAEQPLQTPFVLGYSGRRDPHYRQLVAGDSVYLREGVHDWSSLLRNRIPESGMGAWNVFHARGTDAAPITIQAYPGERPIVTGKVDGVENCLIYVQQSSHVRILGLELREAYGGGIYVASSTDVEIADNHIHDVDGKQENNLAGVHTLAVVGLRIHNNLLHDNYDRGAAQQDRASWNNRNIVMFGEGTDRVEVDHNEVFNTPRADGRATGAGIWIKHPNTIPDAQFYIHDNIVRDVFFTSIGGQVSNLRMENNLIINSPGFSTATDWAEDPKNPAGPLHGLVLDHNSWVGGYAFHALMYDVNGKPGIPTAAFLDFHNNVVVDNASRYYIDNGIIRLSPYGTDDEYRKLIRPENLSFDDNVYFNPKTEPIWNIFAANRADGNERWGQLGGYYNLAAWQNLGKNWPHGLDPHSIVADPRFDDSFIPTNPAAQHAGYWASDKPRLAMFVPRDTFRESAGANASSVTIVRSGMSLASPLTVTLRTSDATEARLPAFVTFDKDVSVVRVPIAAVDDNRKEPTRAVQLFAEASGGLQASEWVRVFQDGGPDDPLTPVMFTYYEGTWDRLPDFSTMTPVKTGTAPTFTLAPMNRDYQFAFRFQTTLVVRTTGDYTFYLGSDDGSRLKIGNTVVVDNDGLHAYAERQGTIRLAAGDHPLTVEFFESGGLEQLTVDYSGPGFARKAIPTENLKPPIQRAGAFEFEVVSRTVNENDGRVTLTVVRNDGNAGVIDVTYATRDGTAKAGQDYQGTTGTLHFDDRQPSGTITVGLFTDALKEPDETFSVELTAVSGGGSLGPKKTATVTIRDVPPNQPPVVVTPPVATLRPDGKSAVLSVLGVDDSGAALRYTWTMIAMPPGAPRPPVFGPGNGTTAGRDLPVTFSMAGAYTFSVTITDAGGLTTSSTLSFTVPARLSAIQITPATAKVKPKGHLQFSAQTLDQFGSVLNTAGSFSWSVSSGKITKSGYFTAPSTSKPVTVTVKKGSLQAKAYVTVSSK